MNNPPAFPYLFPDSQRDSYNVAYGMTLRDYFAAKAMQALISGERPLSPVLALYAEMAYDIADAMLKAREA